MESLVFDIYRKLQKGNIDFLNYSDLSRLTEHKKKNTLYKLSQRLVEKGVLEPVSPGLFFVKDSKATDFKIANYIYQPSYVTLESALSYYGILSQFTYTITSATTKKSKKTTFEAKEYSYSRLQSDLYWGYTKQKDFLIALPEKALLDSIYFMSKGLVNLDFSEMDFSILNNDRLLDFAKKFSSDYIFKKVKEITK